MQKQNKKMAVCRLLLILLSLVLMLTAVSCGGGEGTETSTRENATSAETDETGTEENSDEEEELLFDKKDYKAEFTVLYPSWGAYKDFFFATAEDNTDPMKAAIWERKCDVEEYLGIDLIAYTSGAIDTIAPTLESMVLSNLDTYQLVLTHTYVGVNTLVLNDDLTDLYSLKDISFERSYWNKDAIKALQVGDAAYFALSDFMISDPEAVFFNKRILDSYDKLPDPYKLVRDGEWTLEKFLEMAAEVSVSDGVEKWDINDTYGIAAMANWPFISFADSCDVNWLVDDGGYKTLNMSERNERYANVMSKLVDMSSQNWCYMYSYGNRSDPAYKMNITSDHCLFCLESLKSAYTYRSESVRFGILPYPKYDKDQADYRSFDWSGMMCVPVSVKNPDMVGQTLECLSYYSQSTTVPAYYEKLLGGRLADAPEDAEMLNVIFNNIVLNPTINICGDASNTPLGRLVYGLSLAMGAKVAGGTPTTIASSWASDGKAAQLWVDQYLNR